VLTRKPGEKIIVGNTYQIEVADVERGVAKLIFNVDKALTLMPGNIDIDVAGTVNGNMPAVAVSRKVDDSVVIGQDAGAIEVLIVSVKGESVRVGVRAPREVTVHREEVWRLIQESNVAAAQAQPDLDTGALKQLMERRRAKDK
jgi:carbon storage regulator